MIPTAFDYQRATSLDDALAKLAASTAAASCIAGGHSLVPLMKLRLSEPALLIDIARIPGLSGIRENGRQDRDRRGDGAPRRRRRRSCCATSARCSPRRPARSAIRRCAIAARSAAASRTPIRRPTIPAVMLALDAEIQLQGPRAARARSRPADFFQDLFTVDLAPDEIIAGVQFAPVQGGGVRQAASARVALRDRRRGGGARRQGRRDPVGAHRADRRDDSRGSLDGVEQALAGKKADGIAAAAGQARRLTSPICNARSARERGLSQGDDSGVHAARGGKGAGARVKVLRS